ncbi:MAG: phosphohydrolase [Deltaproteobacteria bacterium]|nr:MAG: phosphohydrolase [Deltaproteobacteria bacterium]
MLQSERTPPVDAVRIIESYYPPGTLAYEILMTHSRQVTQKAIDIARGVPNLNPDIDFIREAAMLHDIGIFQTHAPDIGCTGNAPYICHGYLGRELLERLGYPRHGLVCERHTGTGLSVSDIKTNNLPLPAREMVPISLEEEIICFADKFFSKNPDNYMEETPIGDIVAMLRRFGPHTVDRFLAWAEKFRMPVP